MNRYEHLEGHADAGLGCDEPEIHRFTRVSEREEFNRARAAAEEILRGDSPPQSFGELVDRMAAAAQEEGPGSAATDHEADVPTPTAD